MDSKCQQNSSIYTWPGWLGEMHADIWERGGHTYRSEMGIPTGVRCRAACGGALCNNTLIGSLLYEADYTAASPYTHTRVTICIVNSYCRAKYILAPCPSTLLSRKYITKIGCRCSRKDTDQGCKENKEENLPTPTGICYIWPLNAAFSTCLSCQRFVQSHAWPGK